MKILLATSEIHPYSKTGGLADMVGALAKALVRAGHTVGVVTPLYSTLPQKFPEIKKLDWRLEIPLGDEMVSGELWVHEISSKLKIYCIHQPELFFRKDLYQEDGTDYPDNAARFIFFSKCVAHLARHLPWKPEFVHVHDWQTGLVPVLMLDQRLREGWKHAPHTCITIHNLAYQGVFDSEAYKLTNLPWSYFNTEGIEYYMGMNCLKAGIVYSDRIVTVSPRYAREITTPELGMGLDGVLRRRQSVLTGILNGVDYDEWNTTRNSSLVQPYDSHRMMGKSKNKQALQVELGLPMDDVPLFGTITRLTEQKGMDIEIGALEEMLNEDMQFVLLGSGSSALVKAFKGLESRYPKKVAVVIGYNAGLAHRIEAGSDFYLMPSRFEPCGLNQMYSLRYGTIPIVRRTGGLDDSVVDITEDIERANGIKFTEYSVPALVKGIQKALVLHQDTSLLRHYRRNAMLADFSWERACEEYVAVYKQAMQKVRA